MEVYKQCGRTPEEAGKEGERADILLFRACGTSQDSSGGVQADIKQFLG